jgi:5'-methylthioadenosine phosphorylase
MSRSYALIATATDYDSWRPQSEAVTAAEIFKTLRLNADTARLIAETILDDLNTIISGDGAATILEEVGSMKYSIMPRSFEKQADVEKLAFILPEYFQ